MADDNKERDAVEAAAERQRFVEFLEREGLSEEEFHESARHHREAMESAQYGQ